GPGQVLDVVLDRRLEAGDLLPGAIDLELDRYRALRVVAEPVEGGLDVAGGRRAERQVQRPGAQGRAQKALLDHRASHGRSPIVERCENLSPWTRVALAGVVPLAHTINSRASRQYWSLDAIFPPWPVRPQSGNRPSRPNPLPISTDT